MTAQVTKSRYEFQHAAKAGVKFAVLERLSESELGKPANGLVQKEATPEIFQILNTKREEGRLPNKGNVHARFNIVVHDDQTVDLSAVDHDLDPLMNEFAAMAQSYSRITEQKEFVLLVANDFRESAETHAPIMSMTMNAPGIAAEEQEVHEGDWSFVQSDVKRHFIRDGENQERPLTFAFLPK